MKLKGMIPAAVCVALVLAAILGSGFAAASDGAKVTFDPNARSVNFTYGSATLAYGGGSALTGIRHTALTDLWNDTAAGSGVDIKKGHSTFSQSWGSGTTRAELETTVSAKYDGTLTVSQRADAQTPGIAGVQWGLIVPDAYDLILPVLGGIRLTAESPDAAYGFTQFDYPNIWEAQFFLVQGENGGMLVHANDDARFFKSLHVKHENGHFYVGMETYSPAPFAQRSEATSTDWRLRAYEGDWANGAKLYREWADRKFDLSRLSRLQPEWTKDIQFAVLTDLEDALLLEELAERVDAAQTLLVVPGWRLDPYDVDFPDYTPKPDIAAKVQAAQALGYKVMLYVNIFGVSPDNPVYATMQPYQVKDPFTGQLVYSEYTAGSQHIRFAQINPAAAAWRQLFVDKMEDLVAEVGPDALHLDQSLLMYNDANGTIDGMNMMQGNIALHRELRERLPANIALGGESLNEITTRYEAFAQRHAYGIFAPSGTWDDARIEQVVPASSAIFAPYTTIYGHPDHANPLTEDYFLAWHKVVQNRLGAIPMLTRPNADQIANASPLMDFFLEEAAWYQSRKPRADWTDWTDSTLYAFRTANGGTARYERDASGETLTSSGPGEPAGGAEVLRYVYGVDSVSLPGTIPGWRIYDETKLFGLNPDKTYVYMTEARDPNALHVYELPADVAVGRLSVKTNHAALALQDKLSADAVDFLDYPGPIRAGERLSDGTVHQTAEPFSSENGFSHTFAQGGTVQHWGDRMLAHPPYMGQWQGGHTWLEFDVQLPADRVPRFAAGVQLGSEQNVQYSDGVTFKAYAWETAAPPATRTVLSLEQFSRSATPTPVELDLASLQGKAVTIRMETHPGATVDNDSAVWVTPRIELEPDAANPRMTAVKLVSPQPPTSVVSTAGPAQATDLGNNRYEISAPAGGTLYWIHGTPGTAQLPLSLAAEPFDSSLLFENGTEAPPQGPFGGLPGTGAVLGVEKAGLDAHPPQRGQTHIDYVVKLPDSGAAALGGFAGIKDGADESQGVGFRIAVNGIDRWSVDRMPGDAWMPFEVSLADYAGRTVVVTLITDSLGDYGYDWAFWGEPEIRAVEVD